MRYTGIIILLVLCLILLLLSGCIVNTIIPEIASENLENQENTEKPEIENIEEPVIEDTEETGTENPQKWSGLGMGLFRTENISEIDGHVDILLANGFTEIRMDLPNWTDEWDSITHSKTSVIRVISKGVNVIWGVTQNNGSNSDLTITAENWPLFRAAILSAAQWAQDNGVYEFQLGNEEEMHIDGTTITAAQIIINLKALATDVQEIFTNGKVSYTCYPPNIDDWVTAGKGDIDILASNVCMGGDGTYNDVWKTRITNLVNAFGADGTYLTEFNLSWSDIDDCSIDEAVQAAAVTEMIEYIKASGMTRAIFFCYKDPWWISGSPSGTLKSDGTYRLLWNQALLNSGSVKFATVPVKTATISLPNTIALIPNPDSTSTLASGSSVKSTL